MRSVITSYSIHYTKLYDLALVERIELEANKVQRDIERAIEVLVLEFAGQAHVQPLTAALDDLLRIREIDRNNFV